MASAFSEFKDYLTAEDADKANDDPTYNNRFSNAEATAAEAIRDTGEFLGRNGLTAYKYGFACVQVGLAFSKATTFVPYAGPVAGGIGGCAAGLVGVYVGTEVIGQ